MSIFDEQYANDMLKSVRFSQRATHIFIENSLLIVLGQTGAVCSSTQIALKIKSCRRSVSLNVKLNGTHSYSNYTWLE